MIPIVKWTLRMRRMSTLWWALGLFFLIFITLIFYPSFRDQAAQLSKTFDNLPKAAVQLFGGSSDFFSPVGYLNSQLFFLTLPLVLGILAIGLGSGLISREEQDMTLETLLARPLSRGRVLLAKALAGLIILARVTMVSLVTTVVMAKLVKVDIPVGNIIWATLACFVLVVCFAALAFMLTTIGRARSASLGLTTAIAFGGYIISSLAGTVTWLQTPAKVFPFHYYHSEAILNGHFYWSDVIFLGAVILGCGLISWVSFRRRDIG